MNPSSCDIMAMLKRHTTTNTGTPFAMEKGWGATIRLIIVVIICDRMLMGLEKVDLSAFQTTTNYDHAWKKPEHHSGIDRAFEGCQQRRNLSEPVWKSKAATWLEDASNYNNTKTMPPKTPGAIVHIGKSAGSTVASMLRHGCHSWVPKPCHKRDELMNHTKVAEQDSPVSLLTTYYHTPDFQWFPKTEHLFYVMLLRDPFERTRSAFTYVHPKNIHARGQVGKKTYESFFQCYPTLEDFAQAIGDSPKQYNYTHDSHLLVQKEGLPKEDCMNMARASMQNKVPQDFTEHLFFDTKYAYRKMKDRHKTLDNTVILSVRKENLWEDWKSANQWLKSDFESGPGNNLPRVRDHSDLQLPVTTELSDEGRQFLCGALVDEYEAYIDLLTRSFNLELDNLQQSLKLAQSNCPGLNLTLPCHG
jgi:hypothetical protein